MDHVFLLSLHLISSALVALLGRNRKIGYNRSLALCVVLSAIVGVIFILFSKKNPAVDFAENPKVNQ